MISDAAWLRALLRVLPMAIRVLLLGSSGPCPWNSSSSCWELSSPGHSLMLITPDQRPDIGCANTDKTLLHKKPL